MSLFSRSTSIETFAPRPWWRELSLRGWALLLLGIFATAALVLGLATGETALLLVPKSNSGPVGLSLESSPVLFWLAMAANLVVSAIVWVKFILWLSRRTAQSDHGPSEPRANPHKAATRYDPKSKTRQKVDKGEA